MGGDALSVRPGADALPSDRTGKTDLFVAVLLGHIADPSHPSVTALAARARTDARAAVRAGREPTGTEDLVALRLAYTEARRAAAAIKPAKEVPDGPRWARALNALAALRHRQRAALLLYYVLGLRVEDVAAVIGARASEARTVIEAGVAQAVKVIGQPFDVRRGLRVAGSRAVADEDVPAQAKKPARMPRAVVRSLLAPIPEHVETASDPSSEVPFGEVPEAAPKAPPPTPSAPITMLRTPVPELHISDEMLARLEADGSTITPPPGPKPDILPVRPTSGRPRSRRHMVWAAAIVVLLLAALLPAGANDAIAPAPLFDRVSGVGQQAPTVEEPPADVVVPARADVIRVRRGDSLWAIAGDQLGDPLRWREIWRLNKHQVMRGGERFTDPNLIRPGWRLRLPSLRG